MNTKELLIKNSKGQNLKVWTKNNSDSNIAIVYCHGFSGDSSNFTKKFAEYFGDKYLTCRFDFSGQGQSEGDFIDSSIDNELDDLKSVINYIRENYKIEKLILQGHSFGVAIATIYGGNNSINGFVSLSGEGNLKKAIDLEFNEEQLNDFKERGSAFYENWSKDGEMDKLGVQFLDNMKKYSQDKSISTINCPGLFIHGKNDDVIPLEQTTEAHDLYKGKKDLFLIDGADHSYGFYSGNDGTEDIIKIIENWIYKI